MIRSVNKLLTISINVSLEINRYFEPYCNLMYVAENKTSRMILVTNYIVAN